MDQVVEGHADEVIEMKKKVEEMWESSDSKRVRRTKASEGIPGYSLFGDNVGTYRNDSEKKHNGGIFKIRLIKEILHF